MNNDLEKYIHIQGDGKEGFLLTPWKKYIPERLQPAHAFGGSLGHRYTFEFHDSSSVTWFVGHKHHMGGGWTINKVGSWLENFVNDISIPSLRLVSSHNGGPSATHLDVDSKDELLEKLTVSGLTHLELRHASGGFFYGVWGQRICAEFTHSKWYWAPEDDPIITGQVNQGNIVVENSKQFSYKSSRHFKWHKVDKAFKAQVLYEDWVSKWLGPANLEDHELP